MKLYKLTDEYSRTMNGTQWGEGVTHAGTGEGKLCSNGYIHAYEHPLVAVFMNPVHAGFKNPQLWEAEGKVALKEGPLKCGCVSLTTTKQIPLPKITRDQRVEVSIRCALFVYKEPSFVEWAERWVSGEDRSARSAKSAAEAVWSAWLAAEVAWSAAEAARSAVWSAKSAAEVAWSAARSVESAVWSAKSAESAVWSADKTPLLAEIIESVCRKRVL